MHIKINAGPHAGRTIIATPEFAEAHYPGEWEAIPLPESAVPDWRITPGSFKDRFDTYGYPGLKLTILALARTSDVCYGVLADLQDRAFVDLAARSTELATALSMLAQEVEAAGKSAFTPAMQAAILHTPPTSGELVT